MMRGALVCLIVGALALGGCETTGYGYGAAPRGTQLSQCTRNALIGAGVGAAIGAVAGSDDNRAENAAIGAAAGGLATYGVCRALSAREQQRIENAYYEALTSNAPVNDAWTSDQGAPRSLQATSRPTPDRDGECRSVMAVIRDQQTGAQNLPPEMFCRDTAGNWRPAD